MVKIRLTRGGAKKRPHYRIVAIDERSQCGGRPREFNGTYDPRSNTPKFYKNVERFDWWVANGAPPSPPVRSLHKRARTRAAAAS
jgi:small subunit ribosomal protein S16